MAKTPPSLSAQDTALFLDVDGTLLDIQQHPGDVSADSELISLLKETSDKLSGALSLISGRSLEEVDRIFSPVRFRVAGAHGAELRLDPGDEGSSSAEQLPEHAMLALRTFAEQHPELLLEEKHGGASLHYRRAPELQEACHAYVTELLDQLGAGYRLISGKKVFELAPSAHHKGAAIDSFLESAAFSGRTPVFLGDDVTDEDGFRTVNARDGISVLVGEPRDTQADYYLPDTAAVREWLRTAFPS